MRRTVIRKEENEIHYITRERHRLKPIKPEHANGKIECKKEEEHMAEHNKDNAEQKTYG
jgi:hypothetical protein